MKKFGLGLVKSFVLCTLMLISLQANIVAVGAIESNTASAQLLSYDIEMDDDYGDKDDDIYCTCEDCEAQRLATKNSNNNFSLYVYIISFILMAVYAIFEIFFS